MRPIKFSILDLIISFLFFITANETLAFISSLLIMPLLVFVFSYETNDYKNKWVYSFMGFISYPLYILHIPIFTLVFMKARFVFDLGASISLIVLILISLVCSFFMGNQ